MLDDSREDELKKRENRLIQSFKRNGPEKMSLLEALCDFNAPNSSARVILHVNQMKS